MPDDKEQNDKEQGLKKIAELVREDMKDGKYIDGIIINDKGKVIISRKGQKQDDKDELALQKVIDEYHLTTLEYKTVMAKTLSEINGNPLLGTDIVRDSTSLKPNDTPSSHDSTKPDKHR